jgi:hypothetical protein
MKTGQGKAFAFESREEQLGNRRNAMLKETKLHGLMKQANELRGSIVIVFPFFLRAKP